MGGSEDSYELEVESDEGLDGIEVADEEEEEYAFAPPQVELLIIMLSSEFELSSTYVSPPLSSTCIRNILVELAMMMSSGEIQESERRRFECIPSLGTTPRWTEERRGRGRLGGQPRAR